MVVAAEMIAVNSGLGFLIVDARNAGNRYDLVVAGMVIIGVIGLLLGFGDAIARAVKSFQWRSSENKPEDRSSSMPPPCVRTSHGTRRHGVRARRK